MIVSRVFGVSTRCLCVLVRFCVGTASTACWPVRSLFVDAEMRGR